MRCVTTDRPDHCELEIKQSSLLFVVSGLERLQHERGLSGARFLSLDSDHSLLLCAAPIEVQNPSSYGCYLKLVYC